MKKILSAILALASLSAMAQETKKVTVKQDNPSYTEEYYVLKLDKAIKQGSYKKFGYKDCLLIHGNYKNNKKDSTWTQYFWRTDIIESQGNYKEDKKTGLWTEYHMVGKKNTLASKGIYNNGERTGIWEFYNRDAELIQKYNYDTKELIYFKVDKDAAMEYEVKTDSGLQKIKLDRPPMYIGGKDEVTAALRATKVKYPPYARDKGITGVVWISFFIDPEGNAIDHEIHEGIGGGCDEEALRAVKQIPGNWLPGLLNGQAVTAKYLYPVKFTIK